MSGEFFVFPPFFFGPLLFAFQGGISLAIEADRSVGLCFEGLRCFFC